jgi:hypothetical protein
MVFDDLFESTVAEVLELYEGAIPGLMHVRREAG